MWIACSFAWQCNLNANKLHLSCFGLQLTEIQWVQACSTPSQIRRDLHIQIQRCIYWRDERMNAHESEKKRAHQSQSHHHHRHNSTVLFVLTLVHGILCHIVATLCEFDWFYVDMEMHTSEKKHQKKLIRMVANNGRKKSSPASKVTRLYWVMVMIDFMGIGRSIAYIHAHITLYHGVSMHISFDGEGSSSTCLICLVDIYYEHKTKQMIAWNMGFLLFFFLFFVCHWMKKQITANAPFLLYSRFRKCVKVCGSYFTHSQFRWLCMLLIHLIIDIFKYFVISEITSSYTRSSKHLNQLIHWKHPHNLILARRFFFPLYS